MAYGFGLENIKENGADYYIKLDGLIKSTTIEAFKQRQYNIISSTAEDNINVTLFNITTVS